MNLHIVKQTARCVSDFNSKWNNLEIAILAITSYIDDSHMRYIANEINRLKNMNISNEEISEQLKRIIPEVKLFKHHKYHMTMPSLHWLWSFVT